MTTAAPKSLSPALAHARENTFLAKRHNRLTQLPCKYHSQNNMGYDAHVITLFTYHFGEFICDNFAVTIRNKAVATTCARLTLFRPASVHKHRHQTRKNQWIFEMGRRTGNPEQVWRLRTENAFSRLNREHIERAFNDKNHKITLK